MLIARIYLLYPRRVYRDLPVRSFARGQTASPLCRLHFLTNCHETSHVHKHHLLYEFEIGHHRSRVTLLIGGFCPPENSNTSDFDEI